MTDEDIQSEVERYARRHRLCPAQLSEGAWGFLSSSRTRREFATTVKRYIAEHGLSPTTFGLWAMNDSRFVFDLQGGRICSQATIEKVCLFMAVHTVKKEAKTFKQEPHP